MKRPLRREAGSELHKALEQNLLEEQKGKSNKCAGKDPAVPTRQEFKGEEQSPPTILFPSL